MCSITHPVVTPGSDKFVHECVGNISWSICNLIVKVVIFFSDCLLFSVILMIFVWNTDSHLPPSFPKYFPFSFRAFQSFGIFVSYMLHMKFFQVIQGYSEIRVSLKTMIFLFSMSYSHGFKRNNLFQKKTKTKTTTVFSLLFHTTNFIRANSQISVLVSL